MTRKHYVIMGLIAGVIFDICVDGILNHPFKFLLLNFFFWGSIAFAQSKESK